MYLHNVSVNYTVHFCVCQGTCSSYTATYQYWLKERGRVMNERLFFGCTDKHQTIWDYYDEYDDIYISIRSQNVLLLWSQKSRRGTMQQHILNRYTQPGTQHKTNTFLTLRNIICCQVSLVWKHFVIFSFLLYTHLTLRMHMFFGMYFLLLHARTYA